MTRGIGSSLAAERRELSALLRQIASARSELAELNRDIELARSNEGLAALETLLHENQRLNTEHAQAVTDVDSANAALEKAVRASETDSLTQLPNRILFSERLAHDIAIAKRRGGRLALLFVDLDDFKQINDRFGHAVGDFVLKHVAATLNAAVRATDTVSRHGGDEFLILLSEVSQVSDASHMVNKIRAALKSPLLADGFEITVSASIGCSVYPDDGAAPEMLIEAADATMYLAKRRRALATGR